MDKFSGEGGNGSSDSGFRGDVDSAGAAMHRTLDKVVDPARITVDRASTAAHETIDKLANNATDFANRFSDQTRFVTEAPARALDYSKSWVKNKPLEAVGAAIAIGFLLGRLTTR